MRRHPDEILSGIHERSLPNLASSVLSNAQKWGNLRAVQQRPHHSDPQIGKSGQNWKLAPNHSAGQFIQDLGQNTGQAASDLPPEYNKTQPDWLCRGEVYCRNPNLAKCGGEAQHLEKLGIWSPPGLSNVQSSTAGPKTARIGVFLVSLERS